MTTLGSLGLESSALRGRAQGDGIELGSSQRWQRHQARGAGQGGHDEAQDVVEDGARDLLAQRSDVAGVCLPQCREVLAPLTVLDDRRRIAEAAQHEVEQETTGATVAVDERVDLLEPT